MSTDPKGRQNTWKRKKASKIESCCTVMCLSCILRGKKGNGEERRRGKLEPIFPIGNPCSNEIELSHLQTHIKMYHVNEGNILCLMSYDSIWVEGNAFNEVSSFKNQIFYNTSYMSFF